MPDRLRFILLSRPSSQATAYQIRLAEVDAEARVVLRLCAPLCSHLPSLAMPAMALSMTQAALAGQQKHRACDECRKSP